MLSVSNVSAGAAGSGYYRAEGYYSEGTPEAEAAAQWFGKAAEELTDLGHTDFEGAVDDCVFSALLDGIAPALEKNGRGEWRQGQVLGRWVDGEREHRPGIDLTFSASKSVSIMALVAGDERVIAAHDAAVRAAMSWLEENAVATRRAGKDGEIELVKGGKILAGLFRHDTSRALDPQLHTHAVIPNMVLNPDGKWTALHNDEIYLTKMLGGEIYRNELARNLRGLGYAVERTGRDGIVELRDVPQDLSALYSKRSEAIGAALEKRGMEATPENRALAALATRVSKAGQVDRAELREAWIGEARAEGIDPDPLGQLKDHSVITTAQSLGGVTRSGLPGEAAAREAREALLHGIAHLSERQSVYPLRDLLKHAMPRLEQAGIGDLMREVTKLAQEKTLLVAGRTGISPLLTDRETLAAEREVIATWRAGRKAGELDIHGLAAEKRDPAKTLDRLLEQTSLTPGQRDAVRVGLTGTSQIVGVQGYAGTGKTFMIDTLRRYAEKAGYELQGLAPSGRAVEALREAIPEAKTMQSWLMQIRSGGDPAGQGANRRILVVDEAGMVSASEMRDLLSHARGAGFARVILVGDVKQLDAVSAGQPFGQLQRAGMPTALMTDIQRQRDEAGREMVLHAIRGEVRAALARVGTIEAVGFKPEIAPRLATRWLEMTGDERARSGIAVLTNALRREINEEIRTGLKLEGSLGIEETTVMALKAAGLTRAATSDARSYTPGDLIHALGSSRQHGLEKGNLYVVLSADIKANSVTVHDPAKGAEITLALRQDAKLAGLLTLYTAEERSFSTGERIRFTIADKERGIINGTRGVIEAIQPETGITVKTDTGQRLTLPLDSIAARSLDHAYASTVHDFQGSTVDRILIGLSSTERLATQKAFYVAVSRMREEAILVTDDAAALAKRITAQTGDRPTALESWLKAERERMARTAEETREREEARRGQVAAERAVEPPNQHPDRAGDAKAPAATTGKSADLGKHFDLKVERTDAEIEASLRAFADKQKQKTIEGPTR
jgi:conjugative relaxase-like TrwC/TraI family protein